MSATLTPRQLEAAVFLRGFIAANGYAPTHREIGAALGMASTNGVADLLAILERKGIIRRAAGKSRALVLVEGAF